MTRTLFSSRPSMCAISRMAACGVWVELEIVSRQHPAALDRMAAASGLMKSIGIDVRGLSEGLVHMSEREVQLRHHIMWRFAVDGRRARRHRSNTIDDGCQRLILDLDRG